MTMTSAYGQAPPFACMTSLCRRVHYRSMDGFYKSGMLFFPLFSGWPRLYQLFFAKAPAQRAIS